MKDYYIVGNITLKRKDNSLHYETETDNKGVIPINTIDSIFVLGHAYMNNEVLNLIGKTGISVHFFDYFENYTGSFFSRNSLNSAPVLLKQIDCYKNSDKRLKIAQKFIIGASSNIMRNIKNRIKSDIKSIEAFKNYISKIPKSETINELMAIEGNIRKKYYSEIDLYMKKNKNNDFIMDKRIIRPPNNKMNSLISFGNSLLYATVLNEIFKTQLNPTISYLHEVQTSRFSLALDIFCL